MPPIDVTVFLATGTVWIEIAMVIFMVVFLAIVAWVVLARPGAFRRVSRIPLHDEKVVTPRDEDERADESNENDRSESNDDAQQREGN